MRMALNTCKIIGALSRYLAKLDPKIFEQATDHFRFRYVSVIALEKWRRRGRGVIGLRTLVHSYIPSRAG